MIQNQQYFLKFEFLPNFIPTFIAFLGWKTWI